MTMRTSNLYNSYVRQLLILPKPGREIHNHISTSRGEKRVKHIPRQKRREEREKRGWKKRGFFPLSAAAERGKKGWLLRYYIV
jgi:hypothetical protein